MASLYTYTDFENRMKLKGLNGQISQADLALAKKNPDAGIKILEAKEEFNAATDRAGELAANAKAENIRNTFGGYTGGITGGEWNVNTPKTPSSFSSEYDDLISTEIKNFNNSKFEYNPQNDPLYSSYKKTYTREGRRASEDAMAQAATMTGGIPSSYAVMAGQQAGNYYASQMADKIPELEQTAYNRYLQEQNRKLDLIKLMMGERDSEYSKHIDDINYMRAEEDRAINESERIKSDAYNAATVGDFSQLETIGITVPEYIKNAAKSDYDRETEDRELSQALQKAEFGDFSGLESLGYIIPDYVKNAGPLSYQWSIEDRANEAADRKLSKDLAIAEAAAGVGDYSKYNALEITPDSDYISSFENKEKNKDYYKIYEEYGDERIIPSNIVEGYLQSDPSFGDWMSDNGFKIGLSAADIATLKKDYPNYSIPWNEWQNLISVGYTEQDLINNGFFVRNYLKGH